MPTALVLTKTSLTSQPLHGEVTREYAMKGTINLGDPYAASGVEMLAAAVTAAAGVACTTITQIDIAGTCADGTHYYVWDGATSKFLAFVHGAGVEAGAVDLSAAAKTSTCTVYFI